MRRWSCSSVCKDEIGSPLPASALGSALGSCGGAGTGCGRSRETALVGRPFRVLLDHSTVDHQPGGSSGRGLQDVSQLAHVAREVIALKCDEGILGETQPASAGAWDVLEQEGRQLRNVLWALAQAGQGDGEAGKPIVKILAEVSCLDLFRQISVGGTEDAYVGAENLVAANPPELAVLQHPQQLGLKLLGHLAHLVQEQGASVGQLEQALPVAHAPREGAALMAEELALYQGLGEHRAVQGKKGALHAPRVAVHEGGGQLLAGARLPLDQYRGLGAGGKLHGLQCREKGTGSADHALIVRATLLADGNLLHQLAVVWLAVFEDEREPRHAHLVDMSTLVLMGMDVKTGVRCLCLADAFDRALLANLVARARVTVGDLVTGSAQHLGQAGAVRLEEGAVGRDDPGILVDDQEGSLVGLRDGL